MIIYILSGATYGKILKYDESIFHGRSCQEVKFAWEGQKSFEGNGPSLLPFFISLSLFLPLSNRRRSALLLTLSSFLSTTSLNCINPLNKSAQMIVQEPVKVCSKVYNQC